MTHKAAPLPGRYFSDFKSQNFEARIKPQKERNPYV